MVHKIPSTTLRVFISSPSDVADERGIAVQVIQQLQDDPLLGELVSIEPIAWDIKSTSVPMLATLTPQEAINSGLPKPSDCDIVIVILWSRIGTPLPADYIKPTGERYRSGTEWEFLDAMNASKQNGGKPQVIVYRRMQKITPLDFDDPGFDEQRLQYKFVREFFDSFIASDGSISHGFNNYQSPTEFRELLNTHLRALIKPIIAALGNDSASGNYRRRPELWKDSPFPGLRAFTTADEPIFFGREIETDDLVSRLADPENRFLAIVGASGSGKSSLVAAGLLPRLQRNAVVGSKDWIFLRFSPGEISNNPFMIVAARLNSLVERKGWRTSELAEKLLHDPSILLEVANELLKNDWQEIFLFIDQFEELFTIVDEEYRRTFINLLVYALNIKRVRLIITLRSDFFSLCIEEPQLAALLQVGTYPLAPPKLGALYEMISRPATLAGLEFEKGLAERILEDTVAQPGGLPLMAYALDELYRAGQDEKRLTFTHYLAFEGVQGAIGRRAEDIFRKLDYEAQQSLPQVIRELVELNENQIATRQRVNAQTILHSDGARRLVEALTTARLLVSSSGKDHEPLIEVAHEALLRSWSRVADWLETVRDDLRLLRRLRIAAEEWDIMRSPAYLWPDERLNAVNDMISRLQPSLNNVELAFMRPESERLLEEIGQPTISHFRRSEIGDRLNRLSDNRAGVGLKEQLPDIIWCPVKGGFVQLEGEEYPAEVSSFEIAKYPITFVQYKTFLDAVDGYVFPLWWEGLGEPRITGHRQNRPSENHPAENVRWYDAVAFCRWLSSKLGYEVRLPTEQEWQLAATGGEKNRTYPWGDSWGDSMANTRESLLGRTTAVGMYPQGIAPCGALDMVGGVWEWCLNKFNNPLDKTVALRGTRSLRGGSWNSPFITIGNNSREHEPPNYSNGLIGFRICTSHNRVRLDGQ